MNFDLERLVTAQNDQYHRPLGEIRRGRKQSHRMWYSFPQIAGLGPSAMAQRYAIGSLSEARAYLAHAVLGPRIRECVSALQDLQTPDAVGVFCSVDAMQLRSSLTLFALAAPEESLFSSALERWFKGARDQRTLDLVGQG